VNARTLEVTTTKGKVRRSRLVKRDEAQQGKDRPTMSPSEVFPEETAPAPKQAAKVAKAQEPERPRTPEEKEAKLASLQKLMDLFDDDSTDDDW